MEKWKKGPNRVPKQLVVNYTPMQLDTHAAWQMNNPNLNPERKFIAENTMKKVSKTST